VAIRSVLLFLAVVAILLGAASSVRADETVTCGDAFDQSQVKRDDGKLLEARRLLRVCSGPSCSPTQQKLCSEWLADVEARVPSFILSATDDSGADLVDVTVTMDGVQVATRLDGRALDVDPGPHSLLFELPDGKAVRTKAFAGERGKGKVVSVVLGRPHEPPAGAEPPNPSPRRANAVGVHVTSDQEDVQLLVPTSQGRLTSSGFEWAAGSLAYYGEPRGYAIVCMAPCNARMPKGSLRLAVSPDGHRVVELDEPVTLDGPARLKTHYESNRGIRALGWVLFGVSLAAGSFVAVLSAATYEKPINDTELLLGIGGGVGGAILGLVLTRTQDTASIQVVPQSSVAVLRVSGAERVVVGSEAPGLGLRWSF
jgi:hypothetical protein